MNLRRIIERLDLFKHHKPEGQDDWEMIIQAAQDLLKAAGVKVAA
jgi:hypothetical protein